MAATVSNTPIATWYRVTRFNVAIEPVEVFAETEATLVTKKFSFPGKTRREQKHTSWYRYYRTWAEAHAYLSHRCEFSVQHARDSVTDAENDLAKVHAMTDPGTHVE